MPGFKALTEQAIKRGLQCPHCKLLLREAVQTEAGDRLCKSCCDNIQQMENHTCSDCGISIGPESKVYPDRAVRRDVLALEVPCEHQVHGCPWVGKIQDWEDHCSKCRYQPAVCPNDGCSVELPLSQLDQHVDTCPFRLTNCQYCSVQIPANQTEVHNETCPQLPVQCEHCGKTIERSQIEIHKLDECQVLECLVCHEQVDRETTQSIRRIMEDSTSSARVSGSGKRQSSTQKPHLAHPKDTFRHIQRLGSGINDLKGDVKKLTNQLEQSQVEKREIHDADLSELRAEHNRFKQRVATLEDQVEVLRQGNGQRETQLLAQENLKQKLDNLTRTVTNQGKLISQKDDQIADIKRTVDSLQGSCHQNTQAIARMQSAAKQPMYWEKQSYYDFSGGDSERRIALERKIEELERQTSLLKVHVSELELQLQASLASTHTGSFLWRIPDVSRRKRDAIDERITSIYSPPFYTGRNGYKMCVRAYLNGDGVGYKTHLSLFFVLMKGEYDPLLQWPFDHKVSLILVDQSHRKHVVQTFKPTRESSSFKQPTSDMNVASGCPQFAKLSVLDDSNYVKDDVLYIKCIVDTSKIFHP